MESTAIYRKPEVDCGRTRATHPARRNAVRCSTWLAAAYLGLAVIVVLSNIFLLRGRELAGDVIALLFAIICAIHAYLLARDYREIAQAPWYSRWYGLVAIVVAFAALAFGVRAFLSNRSAFRPVDGANYRARAQLIVRKWGMAITERTEFTL